MAKPKNQQRRAEQRRARKRRDRQKQRGHGSARSRDVEDMSDLPEESQDIALAFMDLAEHGILMASFTAVDGTDQVGMCAIDWERLRAGGCRPYMKPEDEPGLLDGVAKVWNQIGKSPKSRVSILGMQGREDEVERILSMEGNLGGAFGRLRDRIEH